MSAGKAGFESISFVDLSVFFNEVRQDVCELDSPITLHIPWPVTAGGDYGAARVHDGAVQTVIDPVPADAAAVQALIDKALAAWEVVPCDLLLYPDGDGAFKSAEKYTATYYGALIGEDGVAGTIIFKMTKPNKRTGQFNLSATVKTLVDKQSYSFKAKKVTETDAVTNVNGVLTFALEGSNKKAKAHTLAVTLGGDSLTGAFDGFAIDGARHVFSTSRDPKRDAVKPFVGTWTGAFFLRAGAAAEGSGSTVCFSAKLTKSGSASVKVYFADGKTAGCSAKAEVGADGVVAVPATVWRSVKGGYRSFGFRLVFGSDADGNAVCEAADLSPVRDWTRKTGETVVVETPEFLAAGLQTVTAKDFKTYAVTVDPALTEALGQPAKVSIKLTASTGRITGTLRWKVAYVDARGRERTKTVSGKATGIVVNGVGIGTVTVKLDGVTSAFAFEIQPGVVK